jgi:broad specificity phosphatase PhoE
MPSNETIHLVRHGEVENPKGVIYGRLPGFHLSERGQRQAAAAAHHLKDADIGAVWASPLERAQETAQHIAALHGIEITTDERLLESVNSFEGVGKTAYAILRNPRHWWRFRNPMKPTWGESFRDIQARMTSAISDAFNSAGDREVVIVSHMTPVIVARNALARRRIPPWLPGQACQTGSVTTLVLDNGKVLKAEYFAPIEKSEGQDL